MASDLIRKLKVPAAFSLWRGRYTANVPIDRRLLERAREIRATQGIRPEDFRNINVAVARVSIDGKLDYLDAGNIPARTFGARRGLDSEQVILAQIHELKRRGKKVILEQLYSERIPCPDCTNKLNHEYPNTAIFYTVRELRGRAAALMRAYGLAT